MRIFLLFILTASAWGQILAPVAGANSVAPPTSPAAVIAPAGNYTYNVGATPISASTTLNVLAHDSLYIVVTNSQDTCATHSRTPSDTGNANTAKMTRLAGMPMELSGANGCMDAWLVSDATAASADTISVAFGGARSYTSLYVLQMRNMTNAGAYDTQGTYNPGTTITGGTAAVSSAFTPASANTEIMVACAGYRNTAVHTFTTPDTLSYSDRQMACEYRLLTSTASTTASITSNLTSNVLMLVGVFK